MCYKCSFTPGEVQQENEINHSLIFSKGVICHKLAVRSRRGCTRTQTRRQDFNSKDTDLLLDTK